MSRVTKPKAAAPEKFEPHVRADHNMHTAIIVANDGGAVSLIPLDIVGFELVKMREEEFEAMYYRRFTDYPVEKAAKLYAGYAAQLGGSKEAMEALAKFVTLTPKEIEVATAKKATAKPAAKVAKPAAAKAAKPAVKAAKPAVKKEPGEKKPSAAQMFKDLIMEGKMTDDQIFAKVQKAFDLDDNKRSYVAWYRNDLAKKGMKPPKAKE